MEVHIESSCTLSSLSKITLYTVQPYIDSSIAFKSLRGQFSQSLVIQQMVHLPGRPFSLSRITLYTIKAPIVDSMVKVKSLSSYLLLKVLVDCLAALQLEPVDSSATFKLSSRQSRQTMWTVQSHSILLIDIRQNNLPPLKPKHKLNCKRSNVY